MPVIGSLPMAATSSVASGASSSEIRKGSPPPARKAPACRRGRIGLEAVVAAQDLHRQPGRHDLGDGGRDEGLVGVLGDQLVALVVHHQHQRRRSHRRDLLLDAGQGRGGQQEQGEEASRRDDMAQNFRGQNLSRLSRRSYSLPISAARTQVADRPNVPPCHFSVIARPLRSAFAISPTCLPESSSTAPF